MRHRIGFLVVAALSAGCTAPQSPLEAPPKVGSPLPVSAAPARVSLEGVSLGQSPTEATAALVHSGYTPDKDGVSYVASGPYKLKLQVDSSHRVNQASGTVKEITVPGHPDLKHGESRAEVLKALGPASRDKVDNYASRWVIYEPLNLTLVFDEGDKLNQAYLASPAYPGPQETEAQ